MSLTQANRDVISIADLSVALQTDNTAGGLKITSAATYAPLNSPAMTGVPTAPTAAGGTANTQVATTSFVATAITNGTVAKALNLNAGSIGAVPYQSAANTTAMLSPGTSGYFLMCNGLAAPSWEQIVIPTVPPSIGTSQSWQNVKAARAFGTTYTNSTTAPIMVSVTGQSNTGATVILATVNGVQLKGSQNRDSAYITYICFIVPVGHTYTVVNTGAILDTWNELR